MDGKHIFSKAELPLIASDLAVGSENVVDVLPCFALGEEPGVEGKELGLSEKARVGVASEDLVPPNDRLLGEAGAAQQVRHVLSAWPLLASQLTHQSKSQLSGCPCRCHSLKPPDVIVAAKSYTSTLSGSNAKVVMWRRVMFGSI